MSESKCENNVLGRLDAIGTILNEEKYERLATLNIEHYAASEPPRSPAQPDARELLREARQYLSLNIPEELLARIDALLRGGSAAKPKAPRHG